MGRNVKAREKAGVKARDRYVGGRRVVSSSQSGWLEESYRKVDPFIGELRRHVVAERDLLDSLRPTKVIHPSQAAKPDWCQRASWYEITGADALPIDVGHRMANIFAEGHEIHSKYQRWLHNMGVLYGWYRCAICNYATWGQALQRCDMCQTEGQMRYQEVPVFDEDLLIGGSGDALVVFEERMRLVEIKSIGLRSIEMDYPKLYRPYADKIIGLDELWARVKEPFPAHIRQATLYFHVLLAMDFPVTEIIFLYEFKANQDVKTFTIGYRPEAIAHILRGARQIAKAIDERRAVRRPEWADATSKVCKVCPYRHHCFNIK